MTEPTSQMSSLLAIRDKLVAEQVLKLRIPRWDDPEIVVSYKLLDQTSYSDSMKEVFDIKDPGDLAQASKDANTDLLIKACIGIDMKGSSVTKHWDRFDDELSDALELVGIDRTARRACQGLFLSDGDLLAHARRLVDWSGFANQTVAEGFSGE